MRILNLKRILDFYDVPQIFVASDNIGVDYLCLLYDFHEGDGYQYLGIQISPKMLSLFLDGQIDLRDVYLHPEAEYSIYNISVRNKVISAVLMDTDCIPEHMLPEAGYFYEQDEDADDDLLISESIQCGSPVLHLGFVDSRNSHDIDAVCLSQAINSYQAMITNCHKKLYGKEASNESQLRVTTFSAASFNVHFKANSALDLFGTSVLDETFKKIDELLNSRDDESLQESIRSLKGHTISSYKNFISVLLQNRLSVKYKWVSSTLERKVYSRYVNFDRVERMWNVIQASQVISSEDRTFVGVFLASSVENGKWTLRPNDGNKNISGESQDKDLLSGITIESKPYKIKCKEVQEQNMASLNITHKLILEAIQEIK